MGKVIFLLYPSNATLAPIRVLQYVFNISVRRTRRERELCFTKIFGDTFIRQLPFPATHALGLCSSNLHRSLDHLSQNSRTPMSPSSNNYVYPHEMRTYSGGLPRQHKYILFVQVLVLHIANRFAGCGDNGSPTTDVRSSSVFELANLSTQGLTSEFQPRANSRALMCNVIYVASMRIMIGVHADMHEGPHHI